MIEFIVLGYLASLLLSAILLFFNLRSVRKQFASPELAVLNHNLEKVSLFWSVTNESFEPLFDGAAEKDQKNAKLGCYMMALLGLIGPPGLLLYLILSLSLKFLKNDRALTVMKSELARTENLSKEEIKLVLSKLA